MTDKKLDNQLDKPKYMGRPHCILIAGMHRSGTSALSRVLNLLGAEMGYNLQKPAFDNEKGFWEPSEVVAIHENFFADLGLRHDTYVSITEAQLNSEPAMAAREALLRFMKTSFNEDNRLVVIKDPRLCHLLPLWRDVLEQAGFEADFVLPIRSPLEVAQSLQVRNGYHINKSLLMWLRHVLSAERYTRGCRRVFVTYDQLLTDWRAVVAQISRHLGIAWPQKVDDASAEIDAFLDAGMRHHMAASNDGDTGLAWISDICAILPNLILDPQKSPSDLDRILAELDGAVAAFAPIEADDEQRFAARIAEREALVQLRDDELAHVRHSERRLIAELDDANLLLRDSHRLLLKTCHPLSEQLLTAQARIDDLTQQLAQADIRCAAVAATIAAMECAARDARDAPSSAHAVLDDCDGGESGLSLQTSGSVSEGDVTSTQSAAAKEASAENAADQRMDMAEKKDDTISAQP